MVGLMLLNECNYADGDIGTISGYPQVDVRELNALTLSWNQVDHGNDFYFVRLYHNIKICNDIPIQHTSSNW